MKQIGYCKDNIGNISKLYEKDGKYYRKNPKSDDIDIVDFVKYFGPWVAAGLVGYIAASLAINAAKK